MKQETLKTLEKLLTGLVVMDFKKEAEEKIQNCLKEVKEEIKYNRCFKRYKFTFKDEDGLLIIVNEDTERKAFKKAFRSYETPKDRELTIVSKEINAL